MRDQRRAPFCYQTLDAIEAIRGHFEKQQRAMALAVYQTLTMMANDQRHSGTAGSIEATRTEIHELSGVSLRSVDMVLAGLEQLDLLHKEVRKLGTKSLPSLWTLTERDASTAQGAGDAGSTLNTRESDQNCSSSQPAPGARVQEVRTPRAGGAAPNASATREPEEELQEGPSVSPYLAEFEGWLSHHWATTSLPQPIEGSEEWEWCLWAYGEARRDGLSARDMEIAVEGVWRDDWSRVRGLHNHRNLLKRTSIRRHVALGQAPPAATVIALPDQTDERLREAMR